MEYSVTKQLEIQSIVIKASGMINTTVAENMVLQAGAAIAYSNYKRCLFDLTETALDRNQSMTEMFLFVDVFKRAGFKETIKIAALLESEDEHRKMLTNSVTSDGINLKHFTDRKEALAWLCL